MSTWTCACCGRAEGRYSRARICVVCRDALAAREERWCPGCRRPVALAQMSCGVCRPCRMARRHKARPLVSWACTRCQTTRGRRGTSALCRSCHAALTTAAQFWCRRCARALPLAERAASKRLCLACHRVVARADTRTRRGRVPPAGYVGVGEAARRLCYSKDVVSKRCTRGQIPGAVQLGPRGKWWIPEEALCR